MNAIEIKKQIKQAALDLGFCDVGFAKYEKLNEEFDKYLLWLNRGYHASMLYLERNLNKRLDVANILEGVKTIVVCSYHYNTSFEHNGEKYKISRYAWGDDYHNILLPKLIELGESIKKLAPEVRYKAYVDTGSILEKAWAVRSGIGWQGKNSLIISKKFGSYIFLGILLLNIEVPSDSPIPDFCGTCNKCIEFCPTKAIVQPKVVDSNKCISYWTIEAKPNVSIPDEINLEGWIFGCDICQEVCPWNSRKRYSVDYSFTPRLGLTNLDYEFIVQLDPEKFSKLFKNSPIKRAKYEGLIRNFNKINLENEGKQADK
ncbi:MAG: tRNA epoxyqueuosine(34) reductase QueG [Ignavibacteria bacterium]|nr:tRNA epoxyqueuosine(34) reductase QueG [Ignavibacteria bacterium]